MRQKLGLMSEKMVKTLDSSDLCLVRSKLKTLLSWFIKSFNPVYKKNVSFPGSWKPELYLFQEVEKLEMGFANHEFIQLWTGQVPVGHKSCGTV